MVFHGKWYDEIVVGETFGASLTVTETHLVVGAGLFGDFNPLHVDEEFARKSMFGSRILHGPLTSALVAAPAGSFVAGTAIAFLEHGCRFKAPVRAGDTITTRWTIKARHDKPKHKGGVIVMEGVATNQKGEVVVLAEGKMLVSSRPTQ